MKTNYDLIYYKSREEVYETLDGFRKTHSMGFHSFGLYTLSFAHNVHEFCESKQIDVDSIWCHHGCDLEGELEEVYNRDFSGKYRTYKLTAGAIDFSSEILIDCRSKTPFNYCDVKNIVLQFSYKFDDDIKNGGFANIYPDSVKG